MRMRLWSSSTSKDGSFLWAFWMERLCLSLRSFPRKGFTITLINIKRGARWRSVPQSWMRIYRPRAMQREAERIFRLLRLSVYARMDFMLDAQTGKFYCLEGNTLPGMTPTSLLPQMASAAGISYEELCDRVISLSLEKYR